MFHRGINKEHFKRRDLPHWDDPGRRQTLIYRLWDSIPQSKIQEIERLAAENKWDAGDYTLRRLMEESLHHGYGCGLLKYPEIAKIVLQTWLKFDGKAYDLYEWVIMPNHVHLLIHARGGGVSLGSFIGYIKGRTSYKLGKYKNSNIWQRGYYDHIIRGRADYQNTWDYIENNPAKWADDEYYSEQ